MTPSMFRDSLGELVDTKKACEGLAAAFDATPATLGRAAVKAATVVAKPARAVRRAR